MGIKDRDNKNALVSTGFTQFRTGLAAADNNTTFNSSATIDLRAAANAFHNQIRVIAERSSGAGGLSIELWRQINSGSSYTNWLKVSGTTALTGDGEVVFDGLIPALYRVNVPAMDAATSWNLHECHTAE